MDKIVFECFKNGNISLECTVIEDTIDTRKKIELYIEVFTDNLT